MGLNCQIVLILLPCLHQFCKVARKKCLCLLFSELQYSYGAKFWSNYSHRKQRKAVPAVSAECHAQQRKKPSLETCTVTAGRGCPHPNNTPTVSLLDALAKRICSPRCQAVLVKCSKATRLAMPSVCGARLFWGGSLLPKREWQSKYNISFSVSDTPSPLYSFGVASPALLSPLL